MGNNSGGSFLSGRNPFEFDESSPISLFLAQLVLIIVFCRVVKLVLQPLRQPSVIAEIITGIILGPTVFGRIPGYTNALFPKKSIPFLNLVSNIGLILFLFLIGLELEPKMLRNGARRALFISIAGMALPFSVGAAVSYGLYKIIDVNATVEFSTYLVFIGVAMSITAFPVLARILTELKLLKTFVGNTVICAAAVDDCASWCLLALVVSLINSTSGLQALYVFLLGLGYAIFMVLGVRYALIFILKKTNSFNNGPSTFIVCLIFMIVFISAFITDAIGIDAIFGGFLAGVIVPHDNQFALKIIEKIEDIVTILFLPLYFTISGLKTQIGSLNDGKSWGMTILVILVACFGKILGCTFAARLSKLKWRDSLTIGVLMNCKGLVELIVLNIGHDAKVISDKTFAMMVIMALITTFITTPLTSWIYPKSYYQKQLLTRNSTSMNKQDELKVLVCTNKIDHVPSIMNIINLFKLEPDQEIIESTANHKKIFIFNKSLKIHAVRLIELDERYSNIMMYSEVSSNLVLDPIISIFKSFASFSNIFNETFVKVCHLNDYSNNLNCLVNETDSQLLIIPWSGGKSIKINSTSDSNIYTLNQHTSTAPKYANFINDVYNEVNVMVAVLVDRGFGMHVQAENTIDHMPLKFTENKSIYVPFFGGPDDRAAINLSIRFSIKQNIDVIIVYYIYDITKNSNICVMNKIDAQNEKTFEDQYNLDSNYETTNRPPDESKQSEEFLDDTLIRSLSKKDQYPKIRFSIKNSNTPISTFVEDSIELSKNCLVIAGRSKAKKLTELYGTHTKRIDNQRRKVLGDVAECLLLSDSSASLLIVQSEK